MVYKWIYKTNDNFDDIILLSDGNYLTGLYFESENNFSAKEEYLPIFKDTADWLDIYFNGKMPDFIPKYKIENITPFRKEVLEITQSIPFGKIMTYGEIANIIAGKRGIKRMSAQAVGGALHSNPICIIIPCHRVVGKNNCLVGYGGGINNKRQLLKHEQKLDYL